MLELRQPLFHTLSLQELVLWVHLGCSSEEREKAQEVRVNVDFRFKEMPPGSSTDKLEDTICYAQVSNTIIDHCEKNEYKLIERMACEIYAVCKQIAGHKADLGVSVHKVKPPVDRLLGGSHYRCGDFLV